MHPYSKASKTLRSKKSNVGAQMSLLCAYIKASYAVPWKAVAIYSLQAYKLDRFDIGSYDNRKYSEDCLPFPK